MAWLFILSLPPTKEEELGATHLTPNTISHLCRIPRVNPGNLRMPISHHNTTHKLGDSSCSPTSNPLQWAQRTPPTLPQEAFASSS